ncbi:glutamate--tRNA ligase [Candidatus Saccharibacteria bacterium]|nr:MAG: glutamate--tRNA ligase [Candidatus Saccharibacteria bacterium]
MKPVRTRFAPSPTGLLHVGGVRTALFAWLIARQAGGSFLLRLEDTDKNREVSGSGDHIQESLRWLGINWDEGISIGGKYGPYMQSERLAIYKEWGQKLVDAGRAYADPYTAEEVDAFRQEAKAAKQPFLYRNHRPENPPAWDGSQPLRFRSDPKSYTWQDAVMGELSTGPEAIDDFILIKSDGYPTYNFCHIIDDFLMECTHVTRSQEFLASVPKFLNLYEALDITPPTLVTLPFVMGPDGKKKLSKRDGAKDVLDYAREGYLPEALVNFMATLGWNDGTEQEVFSTDDLVAKFSLDRVQKSGAKFDEQRLLWLNGAHIRALPLQDLYARTDTFWPESAGGYEEDFRKQVLSIVQERLKYFAELPSLTSFFFEEPTTEAVQTLLYDESNKQLRKLSPEQKQTLLQAAYKELEQSDFSFTDLEQRLNNLLVTLETKPGILFSLIRIAVSGAPFSPALFDTLHVLGKDTSLERMQRALTL